MNDVEKPRWFRWFPRVQVSLSWAQIHSWVTAVIHLDVYDRCDFGKNHDKSQIAKINYGSGTWYSSLLSNSLMFVLQFVAPFLNSRWKSLLCWFLPISSHILPYPFILVGSIAILHLISHYITQRSPQEFVKTTQPWATFLPRSQDIWDTSMLVIFNIQAYGLKNLKIDKIGNGQWAHQPREKGSSLVFKHPKMDQMESVAS